MSKFFFLSLPIYTIVVDLKKKFLTGNHMNVVLMAKIYETKKPLLGFDTFIFCTNFVSAFIIPNYYHNQPLIN